MEIVTFFSCVGVCCLLFLCRLFIPTGCKLAASHRFHRLWFWSMFLAQRNALVNPLPLFNDSTVLLKVKIATLILHMRSTGGGLRCAEYELAVQISLSPSLYERPIVLPRFVTCAHLFYVFFVLVKFIHHSLLEISLVSWNMVKQLS